ncbi:MAG: cytochrome c [Planctomycetales bacterium]|nr:cytochrome c [Planctomycetales bacterium]
MDRVATTYILPYLTRLAVSAFCFLCGCRGPTTNLSDKLPAAEIFRLHCSECHGDGSGNGHVAATLKVPPRNLKDAKWQSIATDSRLRLVIKNGGPAVGLNLAMPAFSEKLNARQIEDLVEYIRGLSARSNS